jgi:hypothetical protein
MQRGFRHVLTLPRSHQPHNSLCTEVRPCCRYSYPVAIFGRKSARQRLRRATEESLEFSTFSSHVDCTPWVVGGLWPAELSVLTPQNATLAQYLTTDLDQISESANDQLKMVRRSSLTDSAREAAEVRVIREARALAEKRVESTVRQLQAGRAAVAAGELSRKFAEGLPARDLDETTVLPRVTPPPVNGFRKRPAPADERRAPIETPEPVQPRRAAEPEPPTARIAKVVPTAGPAPGLARRAAEPASPPTSPMAKAAPEAPETPAPPAAETADERLQRLLAFVVRQEPRLNWAVGERPDGTTVLATDLAHGWIPRGIDLPTDVRLLEPDRRAGGAAAMIGETVRSVSYRPGDAFGWLVEFAPTATSMAPREVPAIDDLGWDLSVATHWRDGLPRMVHTLAKAAAAGTGVVEQEVDLLRIHLDTALYRLLDQYPNAAPPLLLNCLLLAATDSLVCGDTTSANYHLAWFQTLDAAPPSRWTDGPAEVKNGSDA